MADTTQGLSAKTKLIIIGVIALIVLTIGIVIYRAGKKKGSINESTPAVDNPGNPTNNNIPAASTAEVKQVAQRMYADMSGPNLTHDTDLWSTQVLTLSDTDFVRLYNEFDADYQKDSGETLRQWIENETAYYVPFAGTQWGTIKDTLLTRMNKLNLV